MNRISGITDKISEWFLKLFHKDTPERISALSEFFRFCIVGVSNTLVSYVIYAVTLICLKKASLFPAYDYMIAQATMFALSVLWSFYWNNRMVFTLKEGEHRTMWKALIKTYISYSFTGLFLNSFLLVLWVKKLSVSEFIAPLLNLIISVPLNFMINKFWAFRNNT